MQDFIIFCNIGDFIQVLHSYLKAKRISPFKPLAKQRKNNLQQLAKLRKNTYNEVF